MNEKELTELEFEMAKALKELLGSGYIFDFYVSNARDFVDIAVAHGADAGRTVKVRYEE